MNKNQFIAKIEITPSLLFNSNNSGSIIYPKFLSLLEFGQNVSSVLLVHFYFLIKHITSSPKYINDYIILDKIDKIILFVYQFNYRD